ncbi:MAG: amino acid ABC transporter substrate-binding protein [Chloroflexi bacterium]|nr:amino acid ABC transporter substrate-binding protein [Chloroflexota bacterium]
MRSFSRVPALWMPVFVLALLLLVAATACGGDGREAYRIGVMESLTGAGESYGTVANQAKQMAADEINNAGGIDGRPLELVIEDSQCSAQGAVAAYRKLTDVEGIKIILGTSCSGAMLGAAPLAEADGIILFSGLASNPDIAKAGDYIFRTQISDVEVGIGTGTLLRADGISKLATITESTDYAEGVRRTTVAQFEQLGGQVVGEERYASDVIDFRSQLSKLVAAHPEALHLAPQSEFSAGTIIKQARELGYQGPIYAETVSVGTTALEIAGDAATGMKAIVSDLDPANEKGQQVLANFRERYNYVTLPWHLGSAYDDVYIAAECLKQTTDDQDADGFRDCMYGITWSGAIGDNYSFDADGEVVGLSRVVVQILPTGERTPDKKYNVLGPAPKSP